MFDIYDIEKIIPHSKYITMIDKIINIKKNFISGVKYVTINERFLQHHYPNQPIMPGIIQLETIAQLGSFFFA